MADSVMATRTEVLQGRLAVDTSAWRTGLAQASTMFKSFSGSIGRGLSSAFSSSLGSIKGTLSSIGGMISSTIGGALQALGIGGLLSTGGILAGIKNVADLGGEISDVSARTGIAADQLVILREQFRQGGIEAGSVTQYIRRMNEALMDGSKKNLFKALGLDAKALLSGGPVEALNAIINSVRALNSTAAQQGVLSKIFGGRQGINLMTLVVDEGSGEKAKAMIGSLSGIIKKNMDDFDTISDNLFGGIPIKMQQAFAGFLDAIKKPLLALTDLVTKADFGPMGRSLGDALMWAWGMFRGLVENKALWNYVRLQLQSAFLSAISILSAGLQSAFSNLFSRNNLLVLSSLFSGLGTVIGVSIAESLPKMLGGGTNANRSSMQQSGMSMMNDALTLAPQAALESLRNFATDLGNWRADSFFAKRLEDLDAQMYLMRSEAGMARNLSADAPAILGPTFRPGATATDRSTIFNQADRKVGAANEKTIIDLLSKTAENTAATAEAAEEWAIE